LNKDEKYRIRKFESARMFIELIDRLFLGENNIKNIIENNKYLNGLENVARYAFLYLLARYPLLVVEEELLKVGFEG
jgi:hypothetical protein